MQLTNMQGVPYFPKLSVELTLSGEDKDQAEEFLSALLVLTSPSEKTTPDFNLTLVMSMSEAKLVKGKVIYTYKRSFADLSPD